MYLKLNNCVCENSYEFHRYDRHHYFLVIYFLLIQCVESITALFFSEIFLINNYH
jgi:hypothetical protein